MSNSSKVYVIDTKRGKGGRTGARGSERVEYRPESQPDAYQDSDSSGSRGRRKDSPALSLLSYFLGPLAVVAMRRGRTNKIRILIAAASVILSVVALSMWRSIFSGPATGRFADGVWIFMGCLAVVIAFLLWSNSVMVLGRQRSSALKRLPEWIRKPFSAGLLGLLAPGLGLYATGHGIRAALALWISGVTVISALVLAHAEWIWRWNEATGYTAMAPQTLENLFLALGAAGLFGVLAWIFQALDGMRLAGARSTRHVYARGDMLAVLLLAVIVVFGFSFEPALVARALDEFAGAAYGEGFRVIPLHAARSAAALDPSEPVYVLRAASIYEDLGMNGEARALRLQLWNRWEPCIEVFEEQGRLARSEFPVQHDVASDDRTAPAGPFSDSVVFIGERKAGRLTTWDRLDALWGSAEIRSATLAVNAR